MNTIDNPKDISDLKNAVALLEAPSLAIQIASTIGKPIEWAIDKLPKSAATSIQRAVHTALDKSVSAALFTMNGAKADKSSNKMHMSLAAFSGAAGGFFGLAGAFLELPFSTTIMMRSVADIARSEEFDIPDPLVKIECIQVFAMGGSSDADDAAESAYYALRNAMTLVAKEVGVQLTDVAVKQAAAAAAAAVKKNHNFIISPKDTGKFLARLIEAVANRFGIQVTEKMAAQAVPIVGAISGAAINSLFINHFQNMARGHFTVLRLERRYGSEIVSKQYIEIKKNLIKKLS